MSLAKLRLPVLALSVAAAFAAPSALAENVKVAFIDTLSGPIKLPPAKPEVYCWSASKAPVHHEPPEGGYSPNFIWS